MPQSLRGRSGSTSRGEPILDESGIDPESTDGIDNQHYDAKPLALRGSAVIVAQTQ